MLHVVKQFEGHTGAITTTLTGKNVFRTFRVISVSMFINTFYFL